jgi:hypothetical protein
MKPRFCRPSSQLVSQPNHQVRPKINLPDRTMGNTHGLLPAQLFLWGTLLLLLAGCPPPYTLCEVGTEEECACGYGLVSKQVCLEDGTYERCRCDEAVPVGNPDAGQVRLDGGVQTTPDAGILEPPDAGPGSSDAGSVDSGLPTHVDSGSPLDAGPPPLRVGDPCHPTTDMCETGAICHNLFPGGAGTEACFWTCTQAGSNCATASGDGTCVDYNGALVCVAQGPNLAPCGNTENWGCDQTNQLCMVPIGLTMPRCLTPCSLTDAGPCSTEISGAACGCTGSESQCSNRLLLQEVPLEGICIAPTELDDTCNETDNSDPLLVCSNNQVCSTESLVCSEGIHAAILSDLSSDDTITDGLGDKNQWVHATELNWTTSTLTARLSGMLGADAATTFEDESIEITASYEIDIDVRAVDDWRMDISQHILGAFSIIDEKVFLEDAGGTASISTITASATLNDEAPLSFNMDVDVSSITHDLYGGEGTSDQEFQGMSATSIEGNGNGQVKLAFSFTLYAWSNSNLTFPAASGDEVAIRLGMGDTIQENFTAGEYPSGNGDLGDRDIESDGHFVIVDFIQNP